MSTIIKRLKQGNEQFVPVTLAEAVVVNTDVLGINSKEITTLDKVLQNAFSNVSNNAQAINTALNTINGLITSKQNKLSAGYGIHISDDNVISVTLNSTLYQIVQSLPEPSAEVMNTIYLIPSQGPEGNYFSEFICITNNSKYFWELLGTFQSSVDLTGYVTEDRLLAYAITAERIKTSEAAGSSLVTVDYDIPDTLYDYIVMPV